MTSFPAHTAVRRVVFASVMALALLVLITPRANAQVGGLGDAVGDSVGGTVDNVTGNNGSNSGSSDDGSGSDSDGGLLDPIGDVVDETVTNTVEVVKDAGNDTVDTVQDVANHAGQTVTTITDSAEETVKNVIKKPKDGRDRSPSKGREDRSTSSPRARSAGSDLAVFGSSLADSMQRDALNPVLVSSSSDTPTVAGDSLVEQIARGALAAAQQAAFPLLLTMLVVGFLMVQNRIDRSDPKLALAPVDSDHDLLSFT